MSNFYKRRKFVRGSRILPLRRNNFASRSVPSPVESVSVVSRKGSGAEEEDGASNRHSRATRGRAWRFTG